MLRISVAGAAVLVGLVAAATIALANVSLLTVSRDPYTNTGSYHATEVEPDTAASGATVVAAFQAGRFKDGGASNVGWATSNDGGSSYTHGFLPGTTQFSSPAGPYARVSDPVSAFDAKHGVWLISTLALNSSVTGVAVIVNRSTTGGVSWSAPVTVAAANGSQFFDKNWIGCDDTPASPHYGNCYAEWDDAGNNNQLHMSYSTDGGLTWTASTVPPAGVIGGLPLVQPNGTVIVPIDNASGSRVESFVSSNGGVGYTGPFAIASIVSHAEAGKLRSAPLPTAAVDSSGMVYVAWSDCRFISSCTANDIVFSTSTTGKAWSAVTRIPIDATTSGEDNFLPGLGVDPGTSGTTAKLGLVYYFYPKTSCATSTCQLDVGFIGSSTGGASWSGPVKLAGPASLNELPLTSQGYMVGDYIRIAFARRSASDTAISVFAAGKKVLGKTCTLGDVTSCNEPMITPSQGLATTAGALRPTVAARVVAFRSDHQPPALPLTAH